MKIAKYIVIVVGALCQTLFCAAQSPVIVIDPGHGGKDPGAVWGRTYEKTINYSIATKTAQIIKAKLPKAKIIYTRSSDSYTALQNRTRVANTNKAALFLSIHTNSNNNTTASGIETYIMGVDKTGANLSVAMKENSVITLEDNYKQTYQGYDPKSSESFIIFSLMQYAYQEQSLKLAQLVQDEYKKNVPLKNRGVKQAGFLVLWRSTMPAILTEIGFLSNPRDRAYITSQTGQNNIAKSIANAAVKFLQTNKVEQPNVNVPNNNDNYNPAKNPNNGNVTTTKPLPNCLSAVYYGEYLSTYFAVQIRASKEKVARSKQNFGQHATKISEHKTDFFYKYTLGSFHSYKEALTLQKLIRQQFPDCFIVAYSNNRQITLQEATNRLK